MTAQTRKKGSRKSQLARISAQGNTRIDARTKAGKALIAWRSSLVADLGGDPSTMQLMLIDLACRARLFLDSIDGWLATQEVPINKRRKSAWPILTQRQGMSDSLGKTLIQLGLERRMPPAPDLQTYLREKYGDDEPAPEAVTCDDETDTPAAEPERETQA